MSRVQTRSARRLAAAAVIAAGGLALTGVGVYASLQATASNTAPQAVSSATLKLTMADNGAGFTTAMSSLVPGDVTNRFVELTNGGTSAAQALTIGVADPTPTKLTNDATNGLQVSISSCPVMWTTAGVCGGTATPLVTTSASALRATAASLIPGPIAAGAVQHLKFSITLPDQNEVTANGVLPAGTIQGLAANLTWTFTEGQRAAATTSS